MEILQTTSDYVICRKAMGENSEHTPDKTGLPDILEKNLGKKAYPVHRLDITTGGLMVYALTASAAADLSAQIQNGSFQKTYLAAVHGTMEEAVGIMEDELFFDRRKGKSYICNKKRSGTKTARLEYAVLQESTEHDGISLCKVELHTGRTHQIRVQFGGRKHPLVGDGKYGSLSNCKDCSLWSWRLTFLAPRTKETLVFQDIPPANRVFGVFALSSI